jgi:hypothetical protein
MSLALLLCAFAVSASSNTVLVLDLKPAGISADDAHVVDSLLAEAIARRMDSLPEADRPAIKTVAELRSIADAEAQRSLLGCDDQSSACMAEIAGAYGARYLLSGSVGLFGGEVVMSLILVDTTTARTLSRTNTRAARLGDLSASLAGVVDTLFAPLLPNTSSSIAIGAGIGGLGLLTAGAGAAALFAFDARLAPTSTASPADKQQAIDLAWPALAVGITGGVLLAAAGVLVTSGLLE